MALKEQIIKHLFLSRELNPSLWREGVQHWKSALRINEAQISSQQLPVPCLLSKFPAVVTSALSCELCSWKKDRQHQQFHFLLEETSIQKCWATCPKAIYSENCWQSLLWRPAQCISCPPESFSHYLRGSVHIIHRSGLTFSSETNTCMQAGISTPWTNSLFWTLQMKWIQFNLSLNSFNRKLFLLLSWLIFFCEKMSSPRFPLKGLIFLLWLDLCWGQHLIKYTFYFLRGSYLLLIRTCCGSVLRFFSWQCEVGSYVV